jgi:hypothetical protein
MKKMTFIFMVALLLVAPAAVGQEKWPIRQDLVNNPTTLRALLQNRFSLLDDDVAALQAVNNIGRGKQFYVYSVTGADTYTGEDVDHPLATLDAAVNKCTANRGDIIYVLQNHAENLAAADAVDADIAGITIVGLGSGDDMPTFTYTNAAGEFVIGKANVTIQNLRFVAGVSAVIMGISVEADGDYFTMSGCEFVTPGTAEYEFYDMVDLAAGANYATIVGNKFHSLTTTTGCNEAIDASAGVVTRLTIVGNDFQGQFAVAGIYSNQIDTDMYIAYNTIANATTGQLAIELTAAATGIAEYNMMYADTWGTAGVTIFDPGSLKCFENYGATAVDKPASLIPSVSLGQDMYQWLNGADGMSTWLAGAKPTNGVSLAEGLRYLVELFANGTPATITAPGTNQTILDIIGGNGTSTTDASAYSILGAIGTDEASAATPFASTNVQDDGDGSVLERLEHVQSDTDKIDGATLSASPTSGSLTTFIANGSGAALGTALAAGKSLVDAIGTNGTTIADTATGIAGIIGVPTDADNVVDSSTIAANRDGSVLERLEAITKLMETGTTNKLVAPASTYSILDILGSDGATTTAAVAGSLLGAIGTNEAAADTAFTSSVVEEDVDGAILERQEALKNQVDDVLAALGQAGVSIGSVFYVDSTTGSDSDTGTSWALAEITLSAAIGDCTSNKGDIIFVAPSHTETLAEAQLTINKNGIRIIGIGTGSQRPVFIFNHANASWDITGASVSIENLIFRSTIDNCAIGLHYVDASHYCTIKGCEFQDTTTNEFLVAVQVDTGADCVTIQDNEFYSPSAGANYAISDTVGVCDRLRILNNRIYGDYAIAGIGSNQINTLMEIRGNVVSNVNSGNFAIELTAAATGELVNNRLYSDARATMLDPGSLMCTGNIGVDAIDEAGSPIPAIGDSTDNYVGTNSANNDAVTTSIVSAPDGSILERQEYLQKLQEIQLATGLRSIAGSAMPIAVWYVDPAATGTADGKSPANAFTTIQAAITACSNTVDDWVLIYDYSGGGATITINKAFVHLIGMGNKSMPYPRIKPASAVAGITFTDSGDRVEIANLVIGGGDQTVACIDFAGCTGGAYGNYIHDCYIGRDTDAPGNDGISIPASCDAPYLIVENCTFVGTVMSGLDQSGIDIAGQCTGGAILNNFFQDIGTSTYPAISITGAGPMRIEGNRINGNDDTGAGWGISLGATCSNIYVSDNCAGSSDAAPDTSAFVDLAADEANAWTHNYSGIVLTLP